MKKLLYLFILIIIPLNVNAISASSYIVMDLDSSRILEGENIDKQSLIASITKIMTCIIAIENSNIEDVVKINDSINEAYGSGIYVQVGEELTLDDLLYGLMLRSGNDAALAIANYVAGSKESFVYLMNEKAKELNMNNTNFVNPSGLEENDNTANTSTVKDMAILTKYAMNNENYRRYVSTKDITIKSSLKTYKWINKNKLLHNYEFTTGGKTGYTKKAKRTLVTTASHNDISLVIVTFNDSNDFNDHKNLYEKYFNNYERKKVLSIDTNYGDNIYLNKDFYLVTKENDNIDTKVEMDNVNRPHNGQIVGKVKVFVNNEEVGYRYLYFHKELVSEDKSFISKLIDCIKRYL